MCEMRVYRVAVSIVVLIAIAISAPTVARARYRDQSGDVSSAIDTDLELPFALDLDHALVGATIRTYVVVEETSDPCTCHASTDQLLARAPKTSPPLV